MSPPRAPSLRAPLGVVCPPRLQTKKYFYLTVDFSTCRHQTIPARSEEGFLLRTDGDRGSPARQHALLRRPLRARQHPRHPLARQHPLLPLRRPITPNRPTPDELPSAEAAPSNRGKQQLAEKNDVKSVDIQKHQPTDETDDAVRC